MCVGVIPLAQGELSHVLRHVLDLLGRCCKATEDLVLCSQEVSDTCVVPSVQAAMDGSTRALAMLAPSPQEHKGHK